MTGAGFQGLSFLASRAAPLTILPYDGGFLAYCKQGILRGENVLAQNPFRFSTLTREHSLLNPWAITLYGSQDHQAHVFLTHRGMFITFGDQRPQAFEVPTGEWMHRELFPTIAHQNNEFTTALSYNTDTGWFAMAYASDSRTRVYNKTLVFYQPSGEWGWLNRAHTGLAEIAINTGAYAGRWYGMCDPNGTLWRFTGEDADVVYPEQTGFVIDVRDYHELPAIWAGVGSTVAIFSDMGVLTDEDITFATRAGVWDLAYETGEALSDASFASAADETADESGSPDIFVSSSLAIVSAVFYTAAETVGDPAPLDSTITIGPIVVQQEEYIDYLGQLQELVVGMADEASADTLDDWLLDYEADVSEDWLALSGEEDWGTASGDGISYGVRVDGTIDAYTVWEANGVIQTVEPETVAQQGLTRHMSGTVTGQYLLFSFTAFNLGERFHLKHLRCNLLPAGQLY